MFKFPETKPQSFDEVIQLIDEFTGWYEKKFRCMGPGNTFAHIALSDYNLEDDYIHWCVEWDRVKAWLEDEMETIEQKCPITHTAMSIYTRIALREEALEKAQVIIRFMLDLTTIPEDYRIWYVEE